MPAPMLTLMDDRQRSTLIKQGAEAKVYISCLFPTPILTTLSNDDQTAIQSTPIPPQNTKILLKYRFPKTYRHHSLSAQLTASRTTAEARALVRCAKAGVNTPAILCVDDVLGVLGLEVIDGKSVRVLLGGGSESDEVNIEDEQIAGEEEIIEEEGSLNEEDCLKVMELMGQQLGKMHQAHVIHGDLTTSNMMVRKLGSNEMEVVVIDFGLSSTSTLPEDKAVDLYVLERAFQSTHPASEHLFSKVLLAYKETLEASTNKVGLGGKLNSTKKESGKREKGTIPGPTVWTDILRKLEDVRLRGRKRSMVG